MTGGNDTLNNTNITNNINNNSNNKTEFVKCLSEFFKRDLVSVPVVKKYPHSVIQQRCGLKAATLELDTAAYPSIEYIAGTRLSVYPANPATHVQSIMNHLFDDIGGGGGGGSNDNIALPPNSQWWSKFVRVHKGDSLKLALTYLFDIMTAPTRDLIKILAENYCNSSSSSSSKDVRKKLLSICASNESWEKWLCSGHRTLRSLFEELPPITLPAGKHNQNQQQQQQFKLPATRLLGELEIQQPRQYSVSNIKSSKRFRTEIIVFQHKFNLRQIELNLRQLRERETFDNKSVSSPKSPSSRSKSSSNRPASASGLLPAASDNAAAAAGTPNLSHSTKRLVGQRGVSSPGARASSSAAAIRNVAEASGRSTVSMRSIRSLSPFASSPPISTHQVKRVSSFSGPLMSMYATASSIGGPGGPSSTIASGQRQNQEKSRSSLSPAQRDKNQLMRSKMSLLSAPDFNVNSDTGQTQSPAPSAKSTGGGGASSASPSKFDGLCSNYLLNLNTNDNIICEFVENPRFTLKGNRERPIMMIGQDVGLVAFRPFWQQRALEHDRAQIFYSLFKDLSPKKFGDMQLVCLTGDKSRIEDSLFKPEINDALTRKVLSSATYLNRKHLLSILSAAHSKSQLIFSMTSSSQIDQPQQQQQQQQKSATAPKSPATAPANKTVGVKPQGSRSMSSNKKVVNNNEKSADNINISNISSSNNNNIDIKNKELLDLGDRIYKLLVENNGCLYTCCDPHMTQAIELLTFESVVRNNPSLTRERVMELLPKWKGRAQGGVATSNVAAATSAGQDNKGKKRQHEVSPAIYTLENTYERARIVQEIYDSSI